MTGRRANPSGSHTQIEGNLCFWIYFGGLGLLSDRFQRMRFDL
jgi:hypothetical protein